MLNLNKYIEVEEDDNNYKGSGIKTYKAKREYIIKEICVLNEEERISKMQLIKNISNENNTKIYDIIENKNYIYIVIDSDKVNSILFDQILSKTDESCLIKENKIKGNGNYLKLSEIKELYNEAEKKVFKINLENKFGSGFLFKINEKDIPFKKVLFTCNHVINESYIESGKKMEIKNKFEDIYINIKENILYTIKNYKIEENNLNKRKIFTDKFIDYTCIEIFDNDFENNIELFTISKNELKKDKDIFILQHPEGEDTLSYSLGQILKIGDSKIYHSASTEKGSSGSPIINREDFSIIGMHFGGIKNINIGHILSSILEDIKLKILNINIIKSIIEKLIVEEKLISEDINNKYLEKEELFIGKLGIIYQDINKEKLIISINLFKFYENNNSIDVFNLIKEIINNIKKSKQKLYEIFIEENSINFVIEKYETNFENYFISKNKIFNFEEIKQFLIQLNDYIKIYKDLNINLDYISFKNIFIKKENDESIKYQFLFYYNKIILDKCQISIPPEKKMI